VLVQVDNEGALYFRDGVYDQDWHADALAIYREFLQQKYGSIERVRELYDEPLESFETVEPPRRFTATTPVELLHHVDWAQAQEIVVTKALRRWREELESAGFSGLPFTHNLPLGENATPLDPAELGTAVELLGLDYYHVASAESVAAIARRTGELSLRAAARGYTAFSSELGAGFPPFFPPLAERDNSLTALTALAYGLRGYNVYMAVERDRWIGAPIDQHGRARPSSAFWRKLALAIERTKFAELERKIDVAIVVPRHLRRLFRALHAFGPLSSAWFEIAGGGAVDACVEDEFGLGAPRAVHSAAFVRDLEQRLDALAIPYALCGCDVFEQALSSARWVVVASSGSMEPDLVRRVMQGRRADVAVSFGPYLPERDTSFRPLAEPLARASGEEPIPLLLPSDEDGLTRALARVRAVLDLQQLVIDPPRARLTLHRDRAGIPRVAFVINPEDAPINARIEIPELRSAQDLLDETRFHATRNTLEVVVEPLSVRMLALDADPATT
jgi:beta-galactosidase